MEVRTTETIIKMACNFKEQEHRSRTRLGYHVFLSRYINDMKKIPKIDQLALIKGKKWVDDNNRAALISDDDESILSTDTPIEKLPIQGYEFLRIASIYWRDMPRNMKNAWKTRAINLNKRILPGKFVNIPALLRSNFIEEALSSMSNEWYEIAMNFQRSVWKDPRKHLSQMIYMFGKERVVMLSQTYRVFSATALVRIPLFGKKNSKLKKSEIIFASKRQTIVHIASQERIEKLLTLNSLCAARVTRGTCIHSCAGKVMLIRDGKESIGYIKSEFRDKWIVHTATNRSVQLNKVVLAEDKSGYVYSPGPRNKYCIVQYVPIRLIVKENGTVRYTLNRYAIEEGTGKLFPQSCG